MRGFLQNIYQVYNSLLKTVRPAPTRSSAAAAAAEFPADVAADDTPPCGDSSAASTPTRTPRSTGPLHNLFAAMPSPGSPLLPAGAADGAPRDDPTFLRALVLCAALGGLLFGYDTGVVASALVLIRPAFDLTRLQQEAVVSATILAAIAGAGLAVPVNRRAGRRPTIIASALTFVAGSGVLALADDFSTLLAGRLVVGLGIGLASMVVPLFIAEVAPARQRGTLVTFNNLSITGGQFVAACVGAGFATVDGGWRWMFGLGAVPAGLMFVGFVCCMPESPRWLLLKGRREDALRVLIRIRGRGPGPRGRAMAEEELRAVEQADADGDGGNNTDAADADADGRRQEKTCGAVCWVPHVRRALLLGAGLQLLQQLSGINTVMYYGTEIVQMAGYANPATAIYWNVGLAACNCAFTVVGLVLVERVGRRKLLLGSLAAVVGVLFLLGGSFYLNEVLSPRVVAGGGAVGPCAAHVRCFDCVLDSGCGFCERAANASSSLPSSAALSWFGIGGGNRSGAGGMCQSVVSADDADPVDPSACAAHTWSPHSCDTGYGWVSVVLLLCYLAAFAPGMGPMPWTINSEIYPRQYRATCVGIATGVNWSSNLLVSLTFLSLIHALTAWGAFWLFGCVSLAGLVMVGVALPETKGKSLAEVTELFKFKQERG